MPVEVPKRNPSAAQARQVIAARRVGVGSRCACGESRPDALIRKDKGVICHDCKRKERKMKRTDEHHFAGKSNSPITVPVPVNDHRAEINGAQYDWPKQTRENPHSSPLLAAAGCIRGFIDYIVYLINKGISWIAELLEEADTMLAKTLGPNWWVGTALERFAPKSDN
jgi:hypothetical protein